MVLTFQSVPLHRALRYDSYWRENLAKEFHRHRSHQQNPGMDRLLNPHGFDQVAGAPSEPKGGETGFPTGSELFKLEI